MTLSLVRKRETHLPSLTISQLRAHRVACKAKLDVYSQKIHNDPAQPSKTVYGCFSDPNGDGIGFVLNNANAVGNECREGALLGSIVRSYSHHVVTHIIREQTSTFTSYH